MPLSAYGTHMQTESGFYLRRASEASGDHVRLEKSAFQIDVMLFKGPIDVGENSLRRRLARGQIVIAIGQNLGLHDGNQSSRLTDGSVSAMEERKEDGRMKEMGR